MRYDEKEELEATGEWLVRIGKAGFSEELTYVPSRLDKLGVAPRDVVDRREWLRDHYHDTVDAKAKTVIEGQVAESTTEEQTAQDIVLAEEADTPEEPLGFDYETCGPWEWVGQVENLIEEAIKGILEPEPDLPDFSELALSARRRRRGKSARVAAARQLVSLNPSQ